MLVEADPEVLAASVESTSEKKVWPELALRGREDKPATDQAQQDLPTWPSGTLGVSQPSVSLTGALHTIRGPSSPPCQGSHSISASCIPHPTIQSS